MAEERMLNDEILLGLIKANSGGGGGGTSDYSQLTNKPQINGNTLTGNKSASDLGLATAAEVEGKQDALTAGANINMTGDVVKAGVVEVVEPDMTVYGNSTESGSKTYTIETTGVYEIFYCLSLQSTVFVTLPNDANVLFESDLTVSSHPVKHIVAELHEGDTVTIAQTPSQWTAVVSGVLKLDAISVVNVAHTGSIADSTITYTLPNDNKYYLVVGACVGKPTGNNVVDSTSGGTHEITRTLTGSGVRFRSVVVKGSDSPSFSFYGYDGGVASIIAYEIEFEEGNWDYNLATKNYVDTALSGKQNTLTFDSVPTDGSTNPVESNGVYDALALKQDKTDNTLQTTSKTVVGAVNELKSGLTNLDNEVNGDATVYPYADVITIEDAVPANVADCSVKIEPDQDLHGFDHPWVGGAGKNKLPLVLANIKEANTSGTWSGNVYTINNGTIEVLTNDADNVIGIKANGTFNAETSIIVGKASLSANSYYYSGSDSGTYETYQLNFYGIGGQPYVVNYTGDTSFTLSADDLLTCRLRIMSGVQLSNQIFYPMIRLSTETDATFAPYTNECPITGHTEVSVKSTGNLCQEWFSGTRYVNGTINLVNTRAISNYIDIEEGIYTISAYTKATDKTVEIACNTWVNKTEGTNERTSDTGFQTNPYTISYDSNKIFSVGLRYSDNSTIDHDDITLMVERGDTAHPYVPYQAPSSATIQLGDTIYGGSVDFDSGVMTVTHADMDMGSVTWTAVGATPHLYQYTGMQSNVKKPSSNDNVVDSYCECYAVVSANTASAGTNGFAITTGGTLRIYDDVVSDATALNTELSGMHLIYELATPLTVQLTPQQIQLLKGTNTLTASTGQISVTVNGVSGAIGSVQEQVNELASDLDEQATNHIVLSIPANTYNTREAALTAMYTTYNALSSDEKRRAYIIWGDTVYRNGYMPNGYFSAIFPRWDDGSSAWISQIIIIDLEHANMLSSLLGASGTTTTNLKANAHDVDVSLCY